MNIPSTSLIIVRERVFLDHKSPENRLITNEITLLNISDSTIPSIFLTRPEFMVGLKIYDESNKELPFYTNRLTRDFFSNYEEYVHLLKEMDVHISYVIWIRLPDCDEIKKKQAKIIKLVYHNSHLPSSLPISKSIEDEKGLFTIPYYPIKYFKKQGANYDTYFIISVPEGCEIRYKININHKIKDNKLYKLSDAYEDTNDNKVISIRMPASANPSKFEMDYYVIPTKNERKFYFMLVSFLIGISIIVFLLNTKLIDSNIGSFRWHDLIFNPINQINLHTDALIGGIVTISAAIIGFMKSSFTNKTRFWLLISIVIAGLSYLLKAVN